MLSRECAYRIAICHQWNLIGAFAKWTYEEGSLGTSVLVLPNCVACHFCVQNALSEGKTFASSMRRLTLVKLKKPLIIDRITYFQDTHNNK